MSCQSHQYAAPSYFWSSPNPTPSSLPALPCPWPSLLLAWTSFPSPFGITTLCSLTDVQLSPHFQICTLHPFPRWQLECCMNVNHILISGPPLVHSCHFSSGDRNPCMWLDRGVWGLSLLSVWLFCEPKNTPKNRVSTTIQR